MRSTIQVPLKKKETSLWASSESWAACYLSLAAEDSPSCFEVLWIQKSYVRKDEELVTSVIYELCTTNDPRNHTIQSKIEPYMKDCPTITLQLL